MTCSRAIRGTAPIPALAMKAQWKAFVDSEEISDEGQYALQLHSIVDHTGDSAILGNLDDDVTIHRDREYRVVTNSLPIAQ